MDKQNISETAKINDLFRKTGRGKGIMVATQGVQGLMASGCDLADLRQAIADYSDFSAASDPYGEHDFGRLSFSGRKLFWKIDYYQDADCQWGCEDPASPGCYRVLTVMLAEEY